MVRRTVSQENAIKPAKICAAAKQLSLGALATVDQNALAARLHQEAWVVASADGTLADVPRNVRANF